ncbi:hypothetical protein [Calycomorphotria hydatis]|uniref:Uncharacterized protein n=1 Tax=Calycomorphotria hydatis TaxID=2528027 RepID=A0A517T8X0_9PLAN|nr:hypothetical protein [Calycomorphotria hydatis]QDT64816.1 hypothetical protein V22_20590 [Calycomorphotria hydatis]
MKRLLISGLIAGYLSVLGMGVVSHTMEWGSTSHPMMYYVVWDMFCGWSGWDVRYEVVGEGVSGKYYQLAPGPWGRVRAHGRIDRRHYDMGGVYCCRIALNTLKHTQHEEMARIFVVERLWSKKYNIPDHLWQTRFEEPKQPNFYHHVRHVLSGDGTLLDTRGDWVSERISLNQTSNPSLQMQMRQNRPLFAFDLAGKGRPTQATGVDKLSPMMSFATEY